MPQREPACPPLSSLGTDLVTTTRWQRRLALARPFVGLIACALAVYAELWWLTPILVFLIFSINSTPVPSAYCSLPAR